MGDKPQLLTIFANDNPYRVIERLNQLLAAHGLMFEDVSDECKEALAPHQGAATFELAERRSQCVDCGAEILGYHRCEGVPGGFGDDEE